MKFQWSIQPSHTQLVLSRVTNLNCRNENIWPPTILDYITLKLFIWLLTIRNIWSFFIFYTSFWGWRLKFFDISIWWVSLWLFGHHTFQYMLLSLFLSQILVCATVFAAHYLFLRFDNSWALKQKQKWVGRDIGTSLCMSQDQQNYWLIIHDKFKDLFTIIT